MPFRFLAGALAVQEIPPDVVHGHWIIPQGLMALLGARKETRPGSSSPPGMSPGSPPPSADCSVDAVGARYVALLHEVAL